MLPLIIFGVIAFIIILFLIIFNVRTSSRMNRKQAASHPTRPAKMTHVTLEPPPTRTTPTKQQVSQNQPSAMPTRHAAAPIEQPIGPTHQPAVPIEHTATHDQQPAVQTQRQPTLVRQPDPPPANRPRSLQNISIDEKLAVKKSDQDYRMALKNFREGKSRDTENKEWEDNTKANADEVYRHALRTLNRQKDDK
ncbi:hypothetical protein [Aneurinibacillus terranovensis]|uniref:hypothetical protein n=1 Tax=Aneurinibacillus terranovensis TaxID=278991 RepID=UPI00041B1DEE|nr:hypothetical protein [Aneurinibacillus terranovensis]